MVVPFVQLHPDTALAIVESGLPHGWVHLRDDYAYGRLLKRLWDVGAPFIIVEQDIVPSREQLLELAACDAPLCGFPYANTDRYAAWLGCTRFSRDLLASQKDLVDEVLSRGDQWVRPGHYVWLADRLFAALRERGVELHTHWPPVPHRNPAQRVRVDEARGWCKWPAETWP